MDIRWNLIVDSEHSFSEYLECVYLSENIYFLPRVKICFYFHTLGHENKEKKK